MTTFRKIFRYIAAAILLLAIFLFAWAFVIEPSRLVVNQQTILLSGTEKRPLRIAMIGDIHAGSPFINTGKIKRLVELTNNQKPDLIVLLGDYMVQETFYQSRIEPEVTASILRGLEAPLGVFAVLGNHDSWYDGDKVLRAFETSGLEVLNNEVKELRHNDRSFWLIGVADAWTNRHDLSGTLEQVPEGGSIILLTHHPDILPQIPNRVQLTLAAHTHGGQVKLPFLGTPIVPSDFGQKYAAGTIREDGKTMYVTTGVGTSILPVRFRVPPEIVVLSVGGL